MTPTRLAFLLDDRGLTSKQTAAKFLDVTIRTLDRWLAGAVEVPESVALLLETMHAKNLSPEKVTQLAK
jgi:hypothetical protein